MKTPPPCLRSMGCLCCGHARGAPASARCNASEDAPYYTRRGTLRKRQPAVTRSGKLLTGRDAHARARMIDALEGAADRDFAHIIGAPVRSTSARARPAAGGGAGAARASSPARRTSR